LLEDWLNITIDRADVFDNSHLFGTNPVGAVISFGPDGFIKNEYRHYKPESATTGNDIAMMKEFITRRYNSSTLNSKLSTLLIVDGGRAQWNAATRAAPDIPVLAVTKGEIRDGDESFILPDGNVAADLSKDSRLFLLLRAVRDEAHRFAISNHRRKRAKHITASRLDEIDGIGAARKRALIRHFGSVAGIMDSDIAALSRVPGISKQMAMKIYLYFHPENG